VKNLKEELAKPRKVAIYASLDSDFCYVTDVRYSTLDEHYRPLPEGEVREQPMKGYVRISQPVAIEFRAISDDDVVANAIQSLDAAEREAINELNAKIAAIREQKAQFLALTHNPEAV
jgi:hypothetical protein